MRNTYKKNGQKNAPLKRRAGIATILVIKMKCMRNPYKKWEGHFLGVDGFVGFVGGVVWCGVVWRKGGKKEKNFWGRSKKSLFSESF